MNEILANADVQRQLLYSLVIVLVLWLVRHALLFVALRQVTDAKQIYRWRKGTSYLLSILAVLLLSQVWLAHIKSLSTYLGLLSAGVAIALQSLILNVAGWIFILWRHPFEVGDRIQIGDLRGDVIDQRAFAFSLLEIGNWVNADQSTGRIVHVPNSTVFQQAVANYTQDFAFIWVEMPVMITFESNWEKARTLLIEIVEHDPPVDEQQAADQIRRSNRRFMVYYTKLSPTVYLSVADSGVVLTMRFMCPPRARRAAEQAIWEQVLRAFAQHDDIDLAYPTRRAFSNIMEGKPGARASLDAGSR